MRAHPTRLLACAARIALGAALAMPLAATAEKASQARASADITRCRESSHSPMNASP